MAFALDQFYQRNRRALTWLIFFGLLWALRGFFALIFLTFTLAFVAAPLIRFGQRYLHMSRRFAIVVVYLLFLGVLTTFASFIAPQVIRQANTLVGNIGQSEARLIEAKNNLVSRHPAIGRAITFYLKGAIEEETERTSSAPATKQAPQEAPPASAPAATTTATTATLHGQATKPMDEDERLIRLFFSQQSEHIREYAPPVLNALGRGSLNMLLALLFSFLISMDIARLGREVESLRFSRLRDFYEETAQPVVRFASVVGRAIQAQAVIAVANTVLTVIGLLILGIPSLAVLAMIVFLCSFIPVLGVFISTTPIVLVAVNAGGFKLAIAAIVLVVVVHLIEAYLLNPLIYGHHLRLNSVIVLMILVIGHHAFGVWGMILGVPVAYYFIHDVFGVPMWRADREVPPPPTKREALPPLGDDQPPTRP